MRPARESPIAGGSVLKPIILVLLAASLLALVGRSINQPPSHLEYQGCMSHAEYVEFWSSPENPAPFCEEEMR
jgi:hypothetical protein